MPSDHMHFSTLFQEGIADLACVSGKNWSRELLWWQQINIWVFGSTADLKVNNLITRSQKILKFSSKQLTPCLTRYTLCRVCDMSSLFTVCFLRLPEVFFRGSAWFFLKAGAVRLPHPCDISESPVVYIRSPDFHSFIARLFLWPQVVNIWPDLLYQTSF